MFISSAPGNADIVSEFEYGIGDAEKAKKTLSDAGYTGVGSKVVAPDGKPVPSLRFAVQAGDKLTYVMRSANSASATTLRRTWACDSGRPSASTVMSPKVLRPSSMDDIGSPPSFPAEPSRQGEKSRLAPKRREPRIDEQVRQHGRALLVRPLEIAECRVALAQAGEQQREIV